MKKKELAVAGAIAVIALTGSSEFALASEGNELEVAFTAPPQSAKPLAWWHWIGYNVSSNGIVRDLTAMKEWGIGGVTCFTIASQAGSWCGTPLENQFDPALSYLNERWWGYLKHATETAASLGLEFGIHNCAGFSSTGGPWIKPENAIQHLVWTCVKAGETPPEPDHGPLGYYREIGVVLYGGKAYRFGAIAVDSRPTPSPADVRNSLLECDKMSRRAIDLHLDAVLSGLKKHLGDHLGKTFTHWLNDSYEAAWGQWTDSFRKDFQRLCGYDPLPYLPALAGAEMADGKRFLEDHSRVVALLHLKNHYEPTQARLKSEGLDYYLEPYGGPFDRWAVGAAVDHPMVEFWSTKFPREKDYMQFGGNSHATLAAGRAAGRRWFPAEAFTGYPTKTRWDESPRDLKMSGDAAFVGGINRLAIHHWTHQPFAPELKPGNSMGFWGVHFGENQTWSVHAKAWIAYLSRCQALLQRGEPTVDQLALRDEPKWTEFDAVGDEDFLKLEVIADGRVRLPSGRTYSLVRLPRQGGEAIDLAVARKVKALVAAGAAVWAPTRFVRASGLKDKDAADAEVRAIAAWLWNKPQARFFTGGIDAALAALNLKAPFEVLGANDASRPTVGCARREGGSDFYFVANLSSNAVRRTLALRTVGKVPEIWNPETGARESLKYWREEGGRTVLEREFGPNEAFFVVFRRPGRPASAELPAAVRTPIRLGGQWTVSFEEGRGAPSGEIPLEYLQDLATLDDFGIRHFSGVATYRKIFPFNDWLRVDVGGEEKVPLGEIKRTAKRYYLDLGQVEVTAEVILNGKNCGIVWKKPYVVDITDALDSSPEAIKNELIVKVATSWRNRLIGDHHEPDDCEWGVGNERAGEGVGRPLKYLPDFVLNGTPRPSSRRITFATWDYFGLNSPLVPSGLIGPIKILAEAQ